MNETCGRSELLHGESMDCVSTCDSHITLPSRLNPYLNTLQHLAVFTTEYMSDGVIHVFWLGIHLLHILKLPSLSGGLWSHRRYFWLHHRFGPKRLWLLPPADVQIVMDAGSSEKTAARGSSGVV